MADNLTRRALACCGLPQAWANRNTWTVLDTDFQDGQRFLGVWQSWQLDPQRPHMLHYVGVAAVTPRFAPATDLADQVQQPEGWQDLAEQCAGLVAGFHRIVLDNAQLSLTLCIGDIQAMLTEQVFQADTVFTGTPHDKWALQLLARRCKRGSRFWMPRAGQATGVPRPQSDLAAMMQVAGFQVDSAEPDPTAVTGCFNPPWDIPSSRTPMQHVVSSPARCAVVGAGIAGASVAYALAVRGWQVTVFDQEVRPASGASSLPAGLAVPHVSTDDNPRSRLTRSGTHLLMQHAMRLLNKGQDWDPSGVVEQRPDGSALWHAQACWIKPEKLVHAWLSHPNISFVGQTQVEALRRTSGLWRPRGRQDQDLGSFEVVVLANAIDCVSLLSTLRTEATQLAPALQDKLAALQAVHGTLSHGIYAEAIPGLPDTPVNGHGCFIPHVPGEEGEHWFAGSSFETNALAAADIWAQHATNMARLRELLPMDGFDLAEVLEGGPVAQWSATRCVTHDRLPLVGPVDAAPGPGIWLCVGMGARGLSLSSLCAELLAARLGAEPLPTEFSLSRSLDLNRPRRRQSQTLEH